MEKLDAAPAPFPVAQQYRELCKSDVQGGRVVVAKGTVIVVRQTCTYNFY